MLKKIESKADVVSSAAVCDGPKLPKMIATLCKNNK